jgi:hypothetical protein
MQYIYLFIWKFSVRTTHMRAFLSTNLPITTLIYSLPITELVLDNNNNNLLQHTVAKTLWHSEIEPTWPNRPYHVTRSYSEQASSGLRLGGT